MGLIFFIIIFSRLLFVYSLRVSIQWETRDSGQIGRKTVYKKKKKYINNNNKEAERVQVERMRNEAGLSLCFSSDISSNLTKQHNTQEEEEE